MPSRGHRVVIRVTEGELAVLREMARRDERDLGTWIRRDLMSRYARSAVSAVDEDTPEANSVRKLGPR